MRGSLREREGWGASSDARPAVGLSGRSRDRVGKWHELGLHVSFCEGWGSARVFVGGIESAEGVRCAPGEGRAFRSAVSEGAVGLRPCVDAGARQRQGQLIQNNTEQVGGKRAGLCRNVRPGFCEGCIGEYVQGPAMERTEPSVRLLLTCRGHSKPVVNEMKCLRSSGVIYTTCFPESLLV